MVRTIKYRDSIEYRDIFRDTYRGIKFLVSPNTSLWLFGKQNDFLFALIELSLLSTVPKL